MLEIDTAGQLSEQDRFFFERYASRFGYQLHNRILGNKNREHLQFIRNLVGDIGHNVIVPNIYFKLYYKRLRSKIDLLKFFEWKLKQSFEGEDGEEAALSEGHGPKWRRPDRRS